MQNIWAISKREFSSYFNSAIAFIAITVFLVLIGICVFYAEDFLGNNEATLRPLLKWAPLLFVFFLPAVTMRLISEEKKTGSLELLITMPIRDIELVLGKLLGAFFFLLVTLALTLLYPILIDFLGPLDWGTVIGGYAGLTLLGLAYLGIGVMTSCWTRNQIVAFILALLICGFLYFIDWMVGALWGSWASVFAHFSFKAHFDNIAKGVLDTRDILFYLSVVVLTVTVSTFSLESRRWT
jgi:ABC-2 type transport system permease protein